MNFDNRASRHQAQHKHDDDRQDRPGKLDLIAAIDLWWFVPIIARTTPESCGGVNQQADNDDKNHRADGEHEHRVAKDCPGRRTIRFENVGHAARVISKGWNRI